MLAAPVKRGSYYGGSTQVFAHFYSEERRGSQKTTIT